MVEYQRPCANATQHHFPLFGNVMKNSCHGANYGHMAFGDGSVQQFSDATLVQTLLGYDPAVETDEGFLQFYFP